jgi:hypothetical protein
MSTAAATRLTQLHGKLKSFSVINDGRQRYAAVTRGSSSRQVNGLPAGRDDDSRAASLSLQASGRLQGPAHLTGHTAANDGTGRKGRPARVPPGRSRGAAVEAGGAERVRHPSAADADRHPICSGSLSTRRPASLSTSAPSSVGRTQCRCRGWQMAPGPTRTCGPRQPRAGTRLSAGTAVRGSTPTRRSRRCRWTRPAGCRGWGEDGAVTLLRILVHVTAETQRHAGHADNVRELIDGTTGLLKGNDNLPAVDQAWWRDYHDRVEQAARSTAAI